MDKVGKDGVITVEEASTTALELEFAEGMQFDKGYISPYFVTDQDRMEAILDDPYFLISANKISALADLLPILEKVAQSGKPLMIIDPACGTGRFMLGVAEYCFTNQIPFVFWNIDIDERMTDATKKHAEHYKIPAIVILGDALLNDFKKAWQIIDGVAKEIDVNPLIEGFKRLSEKNKDGK
jgi:hypothetical protein